MVTKTEKASCLKRPSFHRDYFGVLPGRQSRNPPPPKFRKDPGFYALVFLLTALSPAFVAVLVAHEQVIRGISEARVGFERVFQMVWDFLFR